MVPRGLTLRPPWGSGFAMTAQHPSPARQAALRPFRGIVRPLSVAPMMDRTDRHYRWMMRQLTRQTLLYTEMVTVGAVIHGDRDKLLGFDADEHHRLPARLGRPGPLRRGRADHRGLRLRRAQPERRLPVEPREVPAALAPA